MTDLSGTVSLQNFTDYAYDRQNQIFYLTNSTGSVVVYDYKTRAFTAVFDPGGVLTSVALAPNGQFVLAGQRNTTGSGFDVKATVHRVNLSTGQIENLVYDTDYGEVGVVDLFIAPSGQAYLTGTYNGSGSVPLRTFAASAPAVGDAIVRAEGFGGVNMGTPLIASESGRYVLLLGPNSSGGPIDILDTQTGAVTSGELFRLLNNTSGYHTGQGDITDARGLIAFATYNHVAVADLSLNLVRDFSYLTRLGSVSAVQFTEGGRQLMLLDGALMKVFDTATWRYVGNFKVTGGAHGGGLPALDLVDAHRMLLMRNGSSGFQIVDLATQLSIQITGDASAETLHGSVGTDRLYGRGGDDNLQGHGSSDLLKGDAGADSLAGGDGDDVLTGGAGNDVLNGGAGTDTAVYVGAQSDYAIVTNGDGTQTVSDLRAGSPEGTDLLIGVETISFAPPPLPTQANLAAGVSNILRQPTMTAAMAAQSADWLGLWQAGQLSAEEVTARIVQAADSTTSVATLAYQFFTGKVPTAGGLDYLVSPTGPNPNNLNSAYYQTFSIENRYINFAVNLGKLGEGATAFTQAYGALGLFEATKKAYGEIFGAIPSDAKVQALLNPSFIIGGQPYTRAQYFAIYGGDGPNGQGTKAAMVGWLLAEAAKADIGLYARANESLLSDLADGAALAVDLIGTYGQAEYVFGG